MKSKWKAGASRAARNALRFHNDLKRGRINMSFSTITWSRPAATNNGLRVAEGSDLPRMRARTGPRGTDAKLAPLLGEALDSLSGAACNFWACGGPNGPMAMQMCSKCHAMRQIATVLASLQARAR